MDSSCDCATPGMVAAHLAASANLQLKFRNVRMHLAGSIVRRMLSSSLAVWHFWSNEGRLTWRDWVEGLGGGIGWRVCVHVYCVSLLNGGVWLSRFESRCYSCEVNHRSCFRLTLPPSQLNSTHRRYSHAVAVTTVLTATLKPATSLLHYTTHHSLYAYLNLGPSMHGHENLRLDLHCRNCG